MRYTKLMLGLLGLAATSFAADPYVGTWKMNSAKTKYTVGTAPKEQTATITETGSDLSLKIAGTAADGTKISINYIIPSAGGAGKIIESSTSYDGVSAKRIAPNEREVSYMKGGKAVYTTHSKIASDGNSLLVHTKGLNPVGQTVEADVVYEKQK